MKGYAKIKESNPFSQRSKSKKESPFLDQDFNDQVIDGRFDIYSSNFPSKKSQENEQKPNIVDDDNNKIRNDLFLGKTEKYDDDHHQDYHHEQKHVLENGGEKKIGAVLRRNFTVSSSTTSFGYQKNGKNCSNLERQSSTRVIQEAVKRAFSMRRSSSVNSDRYCRIYDQPKNAEDCDNNYDYVHDYGSNGRLNHHHQDDYDDGFERSGSMETRSMGLKKKGDYNSSKNGKMHVGSKVVKACKRIFSR